MTGVPEHRRHTPAEVDATRRGAPQARAALHDAILQARAAAHGTPTHDMVVVPLVQPIDAARAKHPSVATGPRVQRVVLDVPWDPAVEDAPSSWAYDQGLDARPAHLPITVVSAVPVIGGAT